MRRFFVARVAAPHTNVPNQIGPQQSLVVRPVASAQAGQALVPGISHNPAVAVPGHPAAVVVGPGGAYPECQIDPVVEYTAAGFLAPNQPNARTINELLRAYPNDDIVLLRW